jgi:hypothetical protein
MNKALKIFLVFAIAFAIGIVMWTALDEAPPSSIEAQAGNTPSPIIDAGKNNSKFIGMWKLNGDGEYNTLYVFNDSMMMIDNEVDSMYKCNYKIVGSKVVTLDATSKMHMNEILSINSDTLIFETFLNNSVSSTYTRN